MKISQVNHSSRSARVCAVHLHFCSTLPTKIHTGNYGIIPSLAWLNLCCIDCKEKNLVVILNLYFSYNIIIPKAWVSFLLSIGHIWPRRISFKGDYWMCWKWTGSSWRIVSTFHFCMISVYLRQISLCIIIKWVLQPEWALFCGVFVLI